MIIYPEIQSEVKDFLTNLASFYEQALEKVHMDYRVQKSGKITRDTTTSSALTRRGNIKITKLASQSGQEVLIPRKRVKVSPNNTHNLLHSYYYHQFNSWYTHSKPMVEKCNIYEKIGKQISNK